MLRRLHYAISDLRYQLGRHRLAVLGALAIGLAAAAILVLGNPLESEPEPEPAPAPPVVVRPEPEEEPPEASEPADLGFPAFATANTTRVAGSDPVADAAAVALAVWPSTGGLAGPDAVTLVGPEDWTGAIAASALIAAPVGSPVLVSGPAEVPELTRKAIAALDPAGSSDTGGARFLAVGGVAVPDGEDRTRRIEGANPARTALRIARLRERLTGRPPAHVLLVSSDEAAYAMPAAAWAAASGDVVLFAQRESLPDPTRAYLRRHEGIPVYVLGPESVISEGAMRRIRDVAPQALRVAGADPVRNAIALARFDQDGFGWGITDPGHGLVMANASRPLDAAAAAPLSASGKWGPLLLTDSRSRLPGKLRSYLLDIKPGYLEDPTRAVYNHVWIVGDGSAISVDVQAQIDALAALALVRSGSGRGVLGRPVGQPESEPQPNSR